jgi:ABC-type Co2+ transport system permease subunit
VDKNNTLQGEVKTMYDWIFALIGFLIMFSMLVGIGINQPRGTSVKMWCYGYLAISIGFDVLVILALVNASKYVWLNNLLLGLSAGAATGLGIHVAHHISEEDEHGDKTKKKKSTMFGF